LRPIFKIDYIHFTHAFTIDHPLKITLMVK